MILQTYSLKFHHRKYTWANELSVGTSYELENTLEVGTVLRTFTTHLPNTPMKSTTETAHLFVYICLIAG